ncbi:hypothetical protein K2Z83_24175 [Oscillochloris sp. ZM17-4]|uniref:hypothetical protein n=1 Tax=Oscillochloris sp. ZM17-4 TaxID=2866714 RepID=UPI001C732DB2|nr:hypothetical protein [Oscillochloris sp. ZM17-4]MBX0330758.1 hypothetical protein [Oscillochloris sp. ZM17-4]
MTDVSAAHATRTYIRWALALLGALLLIALSQITTLEQEQADPSLNDLEITLGGIRSIEQTFTTTRPGLVGLGVRIRPGDSGDAAISIPVHLRYADGPPIDLVSATIVVGSAEDGVVSIRFPPLIASRDPYLITGTLRLSLDIPAISPNTGPKITLRKNSGAQGGMSIDGTQQPDVDLAITTLYQIRWADRIWPISAMAAGKPGLLGQPAFYVLLAYLYMLLIVEGALALRRAQTADPGGP